MRRMSCRMLATGFWAYETTGAERPLRAGAEVAVGGLVAPEESEDGDEPRPRVMDAQGVHTTTRPVICGARSGLRLRLSVSSPPMEKPSTNRRSWRGDGKPSHSRRAYHRAHRLLGTVEPLVGGASLHVVRLVPCPGSRARNTEPRRRRAAGRTVSSQPAIR